ncbi:MAG TPA: hypothetical protein VMR21_06460, partial [Vicinamibacteria bacterium]|nr:hypothetical protein [Vicinamibacteria bacterium]
DGDPDGIYFEGDRVVGKSIDSLPWAERAPALRASGVGYVVAQGDLPPPYRRLAVLAADRGVSIYRLEDAAPSVRVGTRLLPAVQFEDVVPLFGRADYDPLRDVVVMVSGGTIQGTALPSRVEVVEETTTRLLARVEAPAEAVLVWSRTFSPAWRASVDGRPATTRVADGHLLGVPLPAGTHEVEVRWSSAPLVAGAAVSLLGLAALVLLRRA